METAIVAGALIFSAIALMCAATYFIVQAKQEADRRGVYDTRISYLAGLMYLVAAVEIAVAIFLIVRNAMAGTKPSSSTKGYKGPADLRDLVNKGRGNGRSDVARGEAGRSEVNDMRARPPSD